MFPSSVLGVMRVGLYYPSKILAVGVNKDSPPTSSSKDFSNLVLIAIWRQKNEKNLTNSRSRSTSVTCVDADNW